MIKQFLVIILSTLALQPLLSQSLTERLDTLLKDNFLHDSDASVVVYDLTDDTLLYRYRENKRCRPASVLKLTTVTAALTKLGSDYTLDTHLYKKNKNLYVKGSMDPLFDEEDMLFMSQSIASGTVIDTLFADCTFCDSIYWGPGWAWDDNPYGFQPYISPLLLCGGAVEVVVTPTAKGSAPQYKCTPQSSFYSVINESECKNTQMGKLTIMRDWLHDSNIIRISGNCTRETKEKLNMYKSADFFIAVLIEKLQQAGITVRNISFGSTPSDAQCIFSNKRAITEIIKEALMESDNICAEALLYHLVAINKKNHISIKEGADAIKNFINDTLGYTSGYSVYDGSGLSPYNHLTANIITTLLQYIYNKPEIFDAVYNSLPLSGVSGTMKHRTKGTAAYKKVRAKTGTVTGVCTLAGYAQAANGHTLAFVIMNSGTESSHKAREWQDKVCNTLCK